MLESARGAAYRCLRALPLLLLLPAGALLAAPGCGSCAVPIHSASVPVRAPGNFDDVEIDRSAQRLYAADRTTGGVDVFNVSGQPAYLATIRLPGAPNGLAVASDLRRVYAGLATGSVAVIDVDASTPGYDAVVAMVPIGQEADLMDYSADRQRLYVSTARGGQVVSIDTASNAVRARWEVGSALEQPRYDPVDDTVCVAGAAAKAIFAINPNTGQVKGPYPLPGCAPAGLAIDPKHNQALIACSDHVLSWDVRRRAVIDSYSEVPGGDVVSYDPASDRFLVASPHASRPSSVAFFSADPIAYEASVTTAGGHAAVFDAAARVALTPAQGSARAAMLSFPEPSCRPIPGVAAFLIDTVLVVVPIIALILVAVRFTLRQRPAAEPLPR